MKKICATAMLLMLILLSSSCHAPQDRANGTMVFNQIKNPVMRVTQKEIIPGKRKPHINPVTLCQNALKPLLIKTYDGSNQGNHPKVLRFDKPWNGWKFWMSFTPYPNGDAVYENPSLLVSDDGNSWSVPKGLTNPVIGAPRDVARGGHYSDSHLVMRGQTMEMWYRYNPAKPKGHGTSHVMNEIFRISSKNGINWSKPLPVIKGSIPYYSPAVLYDVDQYKMWYTDDSGTLYFMKSVNAQDWSNPQTTDLKADGCNVWHQDVIKDGDKFKIIFSAYKKGRFNNNEQSLYYAESLDGIHFSPAVMILSPSTGKNQLDNQMIYRSSIVDCGEAFRIYYSAMNKVHNWHIFQTFVSKSDLSSSMKLRQIT